MTPPHDTSIGPLLRAEAAEAGAVLARSHQGDPAFAAVLPDPGRRRRALPIVFDRWCRDALPFGAVDALRVGGRLAGVAVWLPPGAFPPGVVRQVRFVPDYLPVLRVVRGAFPALVRYMSRAARCHPAGDHHYLEVLGLDDGFRGRGLGRRLVARGLERADAEGLPAYLETAKPDNVAFYERLGFAVADPALALLPAGPTHQTMWRPPRR